MQTTPGTETDDMGSTNTHKGKTAWIFRGPTEHRQICCGDGHSSVKANDKKKKIIIFCVLSQLKSRLAICGSQSQALQQFYVSSPLSNFINAFWGEIL